MIDKVVGQNLCIGCGVCAGVCPNGFLSINFNRFGEYNAFLNKSCEVNCGLCLKVCPFYSENDNEDVLAKERYANIFGIKYHKAAGYYLKSYYGYSLENEHRAKGASGGLTTWLLENLLVQKKVDHVICVTPNDDPEKLFKFQVFDSIDGIRNASGSVYYPVELSEVIKFILDHDGKFALVGLPCFIKAIRLAQKNNLKLKERVKYVIGLVCGQLKSKYYTSFISVLAGAEKNPDKVFFRKKDGKNDALNYLFEARIKDGKSVCIYNKDGVSRVWENRWFTPQTCSYCDDVLAELADVVFMDAWLPEYILDNKGANLLIVRSVDIDQLIVCASEQKQIHTIDILLERVILSQSDVLRVKRNQLAYRLYLARKNSNPVIVKRIVSANKLNLFEKKEVRIKEKMRIKSREEFLKIRKLDQKMISSFLKEDLKELLFWKTIYLYLLFPVRVLFKINREFKGFFYKNG